MSSTVPVFQVTRTNKRQVRRQFRDDLDMRFQCKTAIFERQKARHEHLMKDYLSTVADKETHVRFTTMLVHEAVVFRRKLEGDATNAGKDEGMKMSPTCEAIVDAARPVIEGYRANETGDAYIEYIGLLASTHLFTEPRVLSPTTRTPKTGSPTMK